MLDAPRQAKLGSSPCCCTFHGGDEPEKPACALKFSTTDVTLLVCSAGGETCLCQIDTMNDCSSMGCPARLQFNGFSGEAPTLIACQTAAQWVVRRGCSVEVGVASVSLHFAPQLTFTRIDRLPCESSAQGLPASATTVEPLQSLNLPSTRHPCRFPRNDAAMVQRAWTHKSENRAHDDDEHMMTTRRVMSTW